MTETVLEDNLPKTATATAIPSIPTVDVHPNPIATAIGRLAAAITTDRLGTGGIAELRRALHQEVPGPTFWRLLTDHVEGAGVNIPRGEAQELDWALIMGGMAIMTPRHYSNTSLGRALGKTKFSESRLQTLLATDPGTGAFRDSLYAAIVWLDRNSEPVDWRDIAYLVLWRDPDQIAKHRRKIARDYYSVSQDS